MCSVGQYIQIKSVGFKGGRIFLKDGQDIEYTLDESLNPELEDRIRDRQLDSLNPFVIDDVNNKVALNDYRPLVRYFYQDYGYHNSRGRYSRGRISKVWERRWRQTVTDEGEMKSLMVPFNNDRGFGLPRTEDEMECDWASQFGITNQGNHNWAYAGYFCQFYGEAE